MISRNPQAIIFYRSTKLLNLFVDLCTPDIGHEFTINNTAMKIISFSQRVVRAITYCTKVYAVPSVLTRLHFLNRV